MTLERLPAGTLFDFMNAGAIKPKVVFVTCGHWMLPAIVTHNDPQRILFDRQPSIERFLAGFLLLGNVFRINGLGFFQRLQNHNPIACMGFCLCQRSAYTPGVFTIGRRNRFYILESGLYYCVPTTQWPYSTITHISAQGIVQQKALVFFNWAKVGYDSGRMLLHTRC